MVGHHVVAKHHVHHSMRAYRGDAYTQQVYSYRGVRYAIWAMFVSSLRMPLSLVRNVIAHFKSGLNLARDSLLPYRFLSYTTRAPMYKPTLSTWYIGGGSGLRGFKGFIVRIQSEWLHDRQLIVLRVVFCCRSL